VAVSSGAAALQLSLAALDIGPGDEVLVPAHTAVPTAAAVCAVGAVPVLVDVERSTGTLDVEAAAAAITDRTRAVIPVDLYGRPSAWPDLGLAVVEDAAQAHGAIRGCRGATVAYSFYPTKNLGGIGDGGAIVSDDVDLVARLRRLRVHGMTALYVHTEISQNFRMSEIEAAWLSMTLPDLAAGNARRRAIAAHYRQAAPQLWWPEDHPSHAMHLCVLRVPDRDDFRNRLARAGVATGVHYPLAITEQIAYRHFTRAHCPEAEAWAAECVSLPCFPEMTDAEVDLVATALAGQP
jgi:dTDP-4-amino-4,6-dideoxygalactose transaminase